ncbi:MAG: glucose-1-phosphate cytidylyltransferase [Phycisphaerales bacterium]|jgi:glucose-1-phosphate cytidylyltransferase|nr:glucose-1-phosphate cytidylyltransferase [Phycisphaerales bacterium]
MKVVLFCGGLGLRLREYSENVPKPMVPVGYRPIVWHMMKYYAHYGHRDFILCLGYQADVIKNYFLNYNECVSNDFVLSNGGRDLKLLSSDIDSWSITFVDTGIDSNIGQRLVAVKDYLKDQPVFMANYSDNVTDAPLPAMVEHFERQNKVASFISVKPPQSFHVVESDDDSAVKQIRPASQCGLRINGGYFILKQSIFDYIREGDELVVEPFQRLIDINQLTTYRHDGFWAGMDTFKEKQMLDEMHARGTAPWQVWRTPGKSRQARVG